MISQFDCAEYEFVRYETVLDTEGVIQNHYVIKVTVNEERNQDLAGCFHVTSTWMKQGQNWKLVYNMDSRITNA